MNTEEATTIKSLLERLGFGANVAESTSTGGPELQEDIPMTERPLKDLALPGALGLGALGLGGYGAYKLGQGMMGSEDEGTEEEEELAKEASVSSKESLFIDGFFEACHERGLAPESAAVLFKEAFAPSTPTPVGSITQKPAKYEKQATEFKPTTLTRPFLDSFYRTCYDQGVSPELAAQFHKQAMIEEFKARSPVFEEGFNQTMYKAACSRAALS